MDGRMVLELPSTRLAEGVAIHLDLASGVYVLEVSNAQHRLVERVVLKD